MPNSELIIGKRIYVSLIDEDNPEEEKVDLLSQIVEIVDHNIFFIGAPMYRGRHVNLFKGDKIRIQFVNEHGLFILKGEVLSVVNERGLLTYQIQPISETIRVQRRQHYRVITHVPLVYHRVESGKDIYRQGIIRDISGGGLKFLCKDSLNVGQVISVFFALGSNIEFRTLVTVVRVEGSDQKKFEVSATFDELEFSQRETLIKYIFNIQLDRLKRKADFANNY